MKGQPAARALLVSRTEALGERGSGGTPLVGSQSGSPALPSNRLPTLLRPRVCPLVDLPQMPPRHVRVHLRARQARMPPRGCRAILTAPSW